MNVTQHLEEETIYTFKREDGRWYIHLAAYLEQGWSKQDLELAEGAHKVLNTLSNGAKKLRLRLTLEPFEGANVLELVEHCAAPKGGGIYLLNPDKGYSSLYWICDLALFVFGDIPERMYVKRMPLKNKELVERGVTPVAESRPFRYRAGLVPVSGTDRNGMRPICFHTLNAEVQPLCKNVCTSGISDCFTIKSF